MNCPLEFRSSPFDSDDDEYDDDLDCVPTILWPPTKPIRSTKARRRLHPHHRHLRRRRYRSQRSRCKNISPASVSSMSSNSGAPKQQQQHIIHHWPSADGIAIVRQRIATLKSESESVGSDSQDEGSTGSHSIDIDERNSRGCEIRKNDNDDDGEDDSRCENDIDEQHDDNHDIAFAHDLTGNDPMSDVDVDNVTYWGKILQGEAVSSTSKEEISLEEYFLRLDKLSAELKSDVEETQYQTITSVHGPNIRMKDDDDTKAIITASLNRVDKEQKNDVEDDNASDMARTSMKKKRKKPSDLNCTEHHARDAVVVVKRDDHHTRAVNQLLMEETDTDVEKTKASQNEQDTKGHSIHQTHPFRPVSVDPAIVQMAASAELLLNQLTTTSVDKERDYVSPCNENSEHELLFACKIRELEQQLHQSKLREQGLSQKMEDDNLQASTQILQLELRLESEIQNIRDEANQQLAASERKWKRQVMRLQRERDLLELRSRMQADALDHQTKLAETLKKDLTLAEIQIVESRRLIQDYEVLDEDMIAALESREEMERERDKLKGQVGKLRALLHRKEHQNANQLMKQEQQHIAEISSLGIQLKNALSLTPYRMSASDEAKNHDAPSKAAEQHPDDVNQEPNVAKDCQSESRNCVFHREESDEGDRREGIHECKPLPFSFRRENIDRKGDDFSDVFCNAISSGCDPDPSNDSLVQKHRKRRSQKRGFSTEKPANTYSFVALSKLIIGALS